MWRGGLGDVRGGGDPRSSCGVPRNVGQLVQARGTAARGERAPAKRHRRDEHAGTAASHRLARRRCRRARCARGFDRSQHGSKLVRNWQQARRLRRRRRRWERQRRRGGRYRPRGARRARSSCQGSSARHAHQHAAPGCDRGGGAAGENAQSQRRRRRRSQGQSQRRRSLRLGRRHLESCGPCSSRLRVREGTQPFRRGADACNC
mmetsp:Transcript_16027/g.40768  ORF Transcript_16027/g.40768 Transcript_16027/m.40768 type:complete len:205 (-) Transcript_16027:634-1248(-)